MKVKTMGHPFDLIVDQLTAAILRQLERLPTTDDEFGQVRLSEDEQLAAYIRIRNDPNEWYNIFDKRGLRETGRYARTMENLLRRKATYGSPTDQGGQTLRLDGGGADGSDADSLRGQVPGVDGRPVTG